MAPPMTHPIQFIALFLAILLVGYVIYDGVTSGTVRLRGRSRAVERQKEPVPFWTSIGVASIFFLGFGTMFVSELFKKLA
jgi:hypothetical protein